MYNTTTENNHADSCFKFNFAQSIDSKLHEIRGFCLSKFCFGMMLPP